MLVEASREFRRVLELRPADAGFSLDVEIDYPVEAIGRHRKAIALTPATFRREIARAKTIQGEQKRAAAAGAPAAAAKKTGAKK